jgi:hypothetical protein
MTKLIAIAAVCASVLHARAADNAFIDANSDGRLLTCLVFSMHTIPLLKELQAAEKDKSRSEEIKASLEAVGGKEKIAVAMLDAEIVIEAMAKKVTDKHIIRIDEKLLDNTMWRLANSFYSETVKDKSFNQRFAETFKYTQLCIDVFPP